MRREEDTERRASALAPRQPVRKPYRKPAVRYERVFEVQALTCGKVVVTQGSCHYSRRNS
jgi:hypothetical protein